MQKNFTVSHRHSITDPIPMFLHTTSLFNQQLCGIIRSNKKKQTSGSEHSSYLVITSTIVGGELQGNPRNLGIGKTITHKTY